MITASANYNAANAGPAKGAPQYILTITGAPKVFTQGIVGAQLQAGQYPWIRSLGSFGPTIHDLQATSSLSDLKVKVIDRTNAFTADFAGFTFEGKTATLKHGFSNMASQADFVTLASLVVDHIDCSDDNTAYTIVLKDPSRLAKQMIYRFGDDGRAISKTNPKVVVGNTMDILTDILANQCVPAITANAATIASYKATLLAGVRMKFVLTTAQNAKAFIEQELLKPFGGYGFQNAAGQYTPFFFWPSQAPPAPAPSNTLDLKGALVVPVPVEIGPYNEVVYRFNHNGSAFAFQWAEINAASANKYGLKASHTIDARGAKSFYGAVPTARALANSVFLRYASFPFLFKLPAQWNPCALWEAGDYIYLTNARVKTRAGLVGITNELCEVIDRQWDFAGNQVTLDLIDVGWLGNLKPLQIAPDGSPTYAAATALQRATYAYIADSVSGKFVNGDLAQNMF